METLKNDSLPYEIQGLDPDTISVLTGHFEGEIEGFIRVGPKGYFMPKVYEKEACTLYNLQTWPDQVFIGGWPRSGTTWTQQIVWLILNDLDYAECEKSVMLSKFIYLELRGIFSEKRLRRKQRMKDDQNLYKTTKSHMFYKTHLPLSLLPPKLLETSKMVYVARDPRDAIVSYYHLTSGIRKYKRGFKDVWNLFFNGMLHFCPYFEHVKEAWEKRDNPNLLFLFYEDIQNDRLNTLRRVADFFNKCYSNEQLLHCCSYLDFNNLKDNQSFNFEKLKDFGITTPFLRKGKVGGWREYFNEEMSIEADRWIADNLRGTDLRFPSIDIK